VTGGVGLAVTAAGLAFASALGVLLLTVAALRLHQQRVMRQRLTRFGLIGAMAEPAPGRSPSASDLLGDLGQRWAARLSPARVRELRATLARAGLAEQTTVAEFLGLRLLAVVVGGTLGGVLALLARVPGPLGMLLGLALGYALPVVVLDRMVRARRAAIERELVDAVDVLILSLEAGLSFDSAIAFLCERGRGPLVEELRRYLTDLQLGRSRREALQALATRTQSLHLREFAAAVIQAEELGTGLARALRAQARSLRTARRVRAEELARQAPIKLLFPIVLCIMPMLFIVIIGPAVLSAIALLGRP
jgi:tight adherence protein C